MVKKQLIMDKGLELFAEQGIEATSVQQITERCGISKGAFYLTFKSKAELIVALVDHFMMQMASDIDHLVKNEDVSRLLYQFYYHSCSFFHKNSNFAIIFMKEQTQTINEDVFEKIHYYNQLMRDSLLEMVEKIYGAQIEEIKYDLILCIKSFTSIYAELCLTLEVAPDAETFSRSLVEKTDLIANHGKLPFITKEMRELFNKKESFKQWSNEELIGLVDQKLSEFEDSIEKESLLLLREDLEEKRYPTADVSYKHLTLPTTPYVKN